MKRRDVGDDVSGSKRSLNRISKELTSETAACDRADRRAILPHVFIHSMN